RALRFPLLRRGVEQVPHHLPPDRPIPVKQPLEDRVVVDPDLLQSSVHLTGVSVDANWSRSGRTRPVRFCSSRLKRSTRSGASAVADAAQLATSSSRRQAVLLSAGLFAWQE